jgi:LmbE family N-acetylglucosaminyl deacetylase
MRILYVFPHPDDESYGPAPAMHKQRRQGHEVHLLTLTRGGATRQRLKYGYTIEEMGAVRYQEMQCVAQVLDLSGLKVLDLPDSGLKELDPRRIEAVVSDEFARLQPQVVVTYAVHGISGFHDHLVTHAVVKRAYVECAERAAYLRRLAFYTITEAQAEQSPHFHLNGSKAEEIDCVVTVSKEDVECTQRALDCYVTYQEQIVRSGIRDMVGEHSFFECYREDHDPPLDDLFVGVGARR